MEKRMSGWLPGCSQVSLLSLIPAILSCWVTLGKSLAFSDSYPKPNSTLQWGKHEHWSPSYVGQNPGSACTSHVTLGKSVYPFAFLVFS